MGANDFHGHNLLLVRGHLRHNRGPTRSRGFSRGCCRDNCCCCAWQVRINTDISGQSSQRSLSCIRTPSDCESILASSKGPYKMSESTADRQLERTKFDSSGLRPIATAQDGRPSVANLDDQVQESLNAGQDVADSPYLDFNVSTGFPTTQWPGARTPNRGTYPWSFVEFPSP
jgi:hypothetical protein